MNAIDTKLYRDSLTTLLRNKDRSRMVDDPKYVTGAQRVLDFMHDNWQQQKLCDVVISANNGDLQVSISFYFLSLHLVPVKASGLLKRIFRTTQRLPVPHRPNRAHPTLFPFLPFTSLLPFPFSGAPPISSQGVLGNVADPPAGPGGARPPNAYC